MLRVAIISIIAGYALTACGSVDTARFAMPGDMVEGGSDFAEQSVKRYVLVNGTRGLKDQTIKVSISTDGKTVFINQNGKDYTLKWDGVSAYREGNANYYREIALSNFVNVGHFQDDSSHQNNANAPIRGYYNGGYFLIGYPTRPTQVPNSGTATFSGAAVANLRTEFQTATAQGTFDLTASFSSNSISGSMNLANDPNRQGSADFPSIVVNINPTRSANISGNQFDADMGILFLPGPNTFTVDQSGLEGGFYGVGASSVGATFWGTGTANGIPMFINGGLASD